MKHYYLYFTAKPLSVESLVLKLCVKMLLANQIAGFFKVQYLKKEVRDQVDCLILFSRYYFGRCPSEQAQLLRLPFSRGRSTCYSDRLHDFPITIPIYYKNVYVNSFFPRTARLCL